MPSHSLRKAFILGGPLAVLFASTLYAASPGTSAFSFLKIDPAARPAAMGNTNSVISIQSAQANPAVLSWLREGGISFEHMIYVQDLSYSRANFVKPLSGNSALSVAVGYLNMGGLTRTAADGSIDGYSEQGDFGYGGMTAAVGYGKRVTRSFSWGVSLGAAQETIDNTTSGSAMGSAGFLYVPYRQGYTVGFGVFNIGPQVKGFDLPSGAYLDIGRKVGKDLFVAGKAVGYVDTTTELRVGLEYAVSNSFFLRGGYRYPLQDQDLGEFPNVDITGGFGIAAGRFTLDYAWLPQGDLGSTHRIAITTRL